MELRTDRPSDSPEPSSSVAETAIDIIAPPKTGVVSDAPVTFDCEVIGTFPDVVGTPFTVLSEPEKWTSIRYTITRQLTTVCVMNPGIVFLVV